MFRDINFNGTSLDKLRFFIVYDKVSVRIDDGKLLTSDLYFRTQIITFRATLLGLLVRNNLGYVLLICLYFDVVEILSISVISLTYSPNCKRLPNRRINWVRSRTINSTLIFFPV